MEWLARVCAPLIRRPWGARRSVSALGCKDTRALYGISTVRGAVPIPVPAGDSNMHRKRVSGPFCRVRSWPGEGRAARVVIPEHAYEGGAPLNESIFGSSIDARRARRRQRGR